MNAEKTNTIHRIKWTLAQPHCRMTALRVALFVGTLLFTINHGSAVMNDEMSSERWVSGLLTYMVPFMVSIHGQSSRQNSSRGSRQMRA
ncbi:MAG: nitrate/nitrite transporter NrtS [Cyanobacteria bacterium J06621_11]